MQSSFDSTETFRNPFFIGIVENNNDPSFNYRVKVRIPTIHNDIMTTEQLPWAARVDSPFMGTSDESDLSHAIPEVGSQVLLLAVGNDPNSLLYLGVLHKKTAQTPVDDKYLNTYGIYRKNGQFIGVDKIKRLFQMLFDGDIEVDRVHNITINASDNITVNCSKADITTSGATNVTASGNLTITAPTSTFNGNIECTGTIKAAAEVSAMGGAVNLSTHTHPFPYMAGPTATTGQTNPGVG